MASVTGITVAKATEIQNASIVSGVVNGSGHLILTTGGGSTIDAGDVVSDSVISGAVNGSGHLILTTVDGNTIDAGLVKIPDPIVNEYTTVGATPTWNKPAGAVKILIEVWGAGGNGQPGSPTVGGRGGGGGGYFRVLLPAASVPATVVGEVAAGGSEDLTYFHSSAAIAYPGLNGTNAGKGGLYRPVTADVADSPSIFGAGIDFSILGGGSGGVGGTTSGSNPSDRGGSSMYASGGGGGGTGYAVAGSRLGGGSAYAGSGGKGGFNTVGTDGIFPGGGGGGGGLNLAGGAGAKGRIRVTTFFQDVVQIGI